LPTQLEILWDGSFELRGEFFVVKTRHPVIGSQTIAGFPVDRLRPYLEAAKSVARKVDEVFGQEDAVSLTPDASLTSLGSAGMKGILPSRFVEVAYVVTR